nr:uncharacterized protein LOC127296833 [Lolium perenne]
MLRRAVSLLSGRAAWLRRQPVTAAATLIRRHPETRLGAVDARGYRRMARRIPPARPDGYSTSDGEDDEVLEPAAAAADGEEEEDEDDEELEGFTLDLKTGTIEDAFEDDEEEEEGHK